MKSFNSAIHFQYVDPSRIVAIFCLCSLLLFDSANSQVIPPGTTGESSIRVLFVSDAFQVTSTQNSAAINSVLSSWNNTSLSSASSTNMTIEVANGGQAYSPLIAFALDVDTLIDQIHDHLSVPPAGSGERPIRDQHGADIVIIIAADLERLGASICGKATSDQWVKDRPTGTSNFSDEADFVRDGLDRSGAESGYIAAVSVDPSCPSNNPAHEFGHLFGAGHMAIAPGN